VITKTTEEIREAAESCASFTFEGAEEIGSSDVSCCTRDVCARLGLDADTLPKEDFLVIRTAVRDAIRNLDLR